MNPFKTKSGPGKSSDSDDEFYDVKESWEDNKHTSQPLFKKKSDLPPLTPFKSAIVSPKRGFPIPFRMSDKGILTQDVLKTARVKPNNFFGKTNDSCNDLPLFQSCVAKNDFEFFTDSSHTIGNLPVQPLNDTAVSPEPTPRKRLPPLSKVALKKALKDRLEFGGIALQQELRSGAQGIWVARFSVDGNYFAVGGEETVVRVWEIGNYSKQCKLEVNRSCGGAVQSEASAGVQRAHERRAGLVVEFAGKCGRSVGRVSAAERRTGLQGLPVESQVPRRPSQSLRNLQTSDSGCILARRNASPKFSPATTSRAGPST